MPLTRRQRRLAIASALVAFLTFTSLLARPTADSQKFYAFLEQHAWLCQVVRVGFVLAGKQNEFDTQMIVASLNAALVADPLPLRLDGRHGSFFYPPAGGDGEGTCPTGAEAARLADNVD